MGNCCGKGEEATAPGAFSGTGNRLGSAHEQASLVTPEAPKGKVDDKVPDPVHDPNLTDEQREQQRKERIAAVEARMKKQGIKQPKKKPANNAPLTGPNSKPLMTWTTGQ